MFVTLGVTFEGGRTKGTGKRQLPDRSHERYCEKGPKRIQGTRLDPESEGNPGGKKKKAEGKRRMDPLDDRFLIRKGGLNLKIRSKKRLQKNPSRRPSLGGGGRRKRLGRDQWGKRDRTIKTPHVDRRGQRTKKVHASEFIGREVDIRRGRLEKWGKTTIS